MIYVPNLQNYKCVVVRNEEVIRAYEEKPTHNSNINFRDYYYNSNYYYNDGVQQFNNYSTLPICLDSSNLSDNVYYRNDFDQVLLIFTIMFFFCIVIPYLIFCKLFRKLKLW